MMTTYQFKDMERRLSSIEKDLNNFENNFDRNLKPVLSSSIDRNKYGNRAIEARLDKIVDNAKKSINSLYNELVNGVNRKKHESIQTIKSEAKSVAEYVESLNKRLDQLNNLNQFFANKDYASAISKANEIISDSSNEEICKYSLLIQLKSYDELCSNKLENIGIEDFTTFKEYYKVCLKNSAKKHIVSARIKLFKGVCMLVGLYFDKLGLKNLYIATSDALRCYYEFSDEEKNKYVKEYTKLYDQAINYYNSYSDKLYGRFDYANVRIMVAKSKYYKSEDINNNFFKDSKLTPMRVFSYIKTHGEFGSFDSLKIAFNDARSLDMSDNKKIFIDYWCSSFDKNGWYFCDEIINDQPNKYLGYSLVAQSFIDNYSQINKKENLAKCFSDKYIKFLKSQKEIDFDEFVNTTIVLNDLVGLFYKDWSREKSIDFAKAINELDGISYGMITKYTKLCCLYSENKIGLLNKVLNNTSLRLCGKKYHKRLKQLECNSSIEFTGSKVKLIMTKCSPKNSNMYLLLAGLIGCIIGILLIVIFFFIK